MPSLSGLTEKKCLGPYLRHIVLCRVLAPDKESGGTYEWPCALLALIVSANSGSKNAAYAFVQWITVVAETVPRGVVISHLVPVEVEALCSRILVAGQCVHSLPPFRITSLKIHWHSLAGLLDAAGHSYAHKAAGSLVLILASSPS